MMINYLIIIHIIGAIIAIIIHDILMVFKLKKGNQNFIKEKECIKYEWKTLMMSAFMVGVDMIATNTN